jgi:hypothetical protein
MLGLVQQKIREKYASDLLLCIVMSVFAVSGRKCASRGQYLYVLFVMVTL